MKQHFVMLAHKFNPDKHGIGGYFAAEKKDGHRVIKIPATRGLRKADVPFANLKDTNRHDQETSGLWTRYGNVVAAPDDVLDELPETFLDMEAHTRNGRGGRQEVASIIRKIVPIESEWERINFYAFEMPSPEALFADRHIKLTNFDRVLRGCLQWWEDLDPQGLVYRPKPTARFETTVFMLQKHLEGTRAQAVKQFQLSFQTTMAIEQTEIMLTNILARDGEGLYLRCPSSRWITERSHKALKIKPLEDDEATVIGYVTGKETDKGSKLLGMMGALVLNYKGMRFELSGFTDEERTLNWTLGVCRAEAEMYPGEWAAEHPGQEVPDFYQAEHFPRGSSVTFRYRDLTRAGLPTEAHYWRKDVRC